MAFDPEDKDTKAAIKKLVSEAVTDATDGLASKNTELLRELKIARKGQEISPEAVENLEAKVTDLQNALKASEKTAKKATETAEKAGEQLASELETGKALAIKGGVQAALAKAKVAPHFVEAVTAMLSGKTSLNDDRAVMVGDKSLDDFVTEWSQSDEGKHYIVAPNNSGGGAGGSGGEGGAKTKTRSEFDAMSHGERATFSKDGGKVTE